MRESHGGFASRGGYPGKKQQWEQMLDQAQYIGGKDDASISKVHMKNNRLKLNITLIFEVSRSRAKPTL